mgnify:CR=1 FL=1
MVKKVNIKGKVYKIRKVKHSILKKFLKQTTEGFIFGACDFEGRTIYINKVLTGQSYNETLRHEMVHAFFKECGLDYEIDWARDEMLIDWLALNLPDMCKACEDVDVLNDTWSEWDMGEDEDSEKKKVKLVTTKTSKAKVFR